MKKQNTLEKLFSRLNKEKIEYCIRGSYKHLPKKVKKGDVDILITKKDLKRIDKIVRELGFLFYPHTEPNLFYYYHDLELGLIQLDILVKQKMVPVKKYRGFFIPKDEKPIRNEKGFLQKIPTFSKRKLKYLFSGKLFCVVGPDGSGKTTHRDEIYRALRKFPLKKQKIHFGTDKGFFLRVFDRLFKLAKTYRNKFSGKITITDRYIYLTFRKANPFLVRLLRMFSPKPSIVFVIQTPYEIIKKRKQGQRDLLKEKTVKELYEVFSKIKGVKKVHIDSTKPIKENVHREANIILKEILA